ncbi:uncharacterized protein LOC130591079 [Beta vulgaris subsp. vulgaris]|uniref:uncharacterized protein LOC130591079 n=1 Tax=Beta vulgaris subsp. vulgaris TaxID=3555 RepID=UPI002546E487|nr:uncharacterized protein LOC130591079 [Beta vulgaris subsp. vulgaris]
MQSTYFQTIRFSGFKIARSEVAGHDRWSSSQWQLQGDPVVSIDGNNELFVIDYTIVPTESIASWSYFFSNLKLGVESALLDVFPWTTRRFCCQHLYNNCKNEGFSGTTFHQLFWTSADAYNNYVYTKAMEKIARDLHVLTLLEEIRTWCMKRTGARFDKVVDIGPTDLTDYAKRILETRSDESRFYGRGEYEVRDGNVNFPITLTNSKCECGKWQGSGIPCKNALRVIFNQRLEPADFVSSFFKGATYKLTYGDHIHLMPDPTQCPDFNLLTLHPPDIKRPPGKPTKQRRRGPNEARKGKRHNSVRCKKCKEVGYNSRTCGTDKRKGKGTKRKADAASTSQAPPKRAKKTSKADGASTSQATPKRGKK